MEHSKIAWTDNTANFWMGCTKVSPGCTHCYAETLTTNRMGLEVWGPTASRQEVKSVWANLRRWNRLAREEGTRARVFVMSLGDFAEQRADLVDVRRRAWDAMRACESLDFQILTKRPEHYPDILPADWNAAPWPNVWLGTTIESDAYAYRADRLRAVPAAVWFISAEPLLAPAPSLDLTGIHWLIVGGESGAGFRPMDHAWARALRDKAVASGTALFMKQSAAYRTELGTYLVEADGSRWAWKQFPATPYNPAGTFTAPIRVAA
jgi:protein gp37